MRYKMNAELPESVKHHLPDHAQDIYREAFNHALEEYKNPDKRRDPSMLLEEVSARVAWSAVKKKYEKRSDGDWYEK